MFTVSVKDSAPGLRENVRQGKQKCKPEQKQNSRNPRYAFFAELCVSSYQVHIEAGFMMDFVFNLIGFAVEQRLFYFSLDRAPCFGFFSPKYNLIMQGREGVRRLVKLVSRFMIL